MKSWTTRCLMAIALACVAPLSLGAEPRTEDVAFAARCDGSTQHYVLVYPQDFQAEEVLNVLVTLHGHGSDRWQYVNNLDKSRDERNAVRDVAAARRMLVVAPDYRARTSWMGPKAEADILQILDELKSRFKIGKVVFCGGSMGGSSVLTFAAMHPELVDGVASMNGTASHLEYENFQDAIRESFGGAKAEIPMEYKNRSAEYWPERLTMPVGISASGKDVVVPPASVMRLANVLKKLNRNVLLIYREAGEHYTTYEDSRAILEYVLDKAAIQGGGKEVKETNK